MFKSQGKDHVERELLTRQEREKMSKVPGKVDSEKIQSTQMERLPLCRKKDVSCNKQKGREVRSRCRKVRTFDGRKLREFRSDGSYFLWVVEGKVTC